MPPVLNGREVGAGSIQKRPSVPISTSGTSFSTVVTICTTPASATPRMLTSVSIQMASRATARLESGRNRDGWEQKADVAGQRHRNAGVAGPERDPIAPGDDEAGELAEAGLGIGIGTARLHHDPRQAAEDHRQHQRTERSQRPAGQRDRTEGGERGRQQEDARADHVADDQRRAGGEPESVLSRVLSGGEHSFLQHGLTPPRRWMPGERRRGQSSG